MDDRSDMNTMRHRMALSIWLRLFLTGLVLATLVAVVLGPRLGAASGIFWLGLFLLIGGWVAWALLGRSRMANAPPHVSEVHPLQEADEPAVIHELMDVQTASWQSGVMVFRGRLLESADAAYRKLKEAVEPHMVALLQPDERWGASIYLMPKPVEQEVLERPSRIWVNWLLFGLSFLTTTFAGADYAGVNLLQEPGRFAVGLPYAIGLLAILGVHELGHFFAARRHGMNVTPPYFIPVPFALGTFGAFIRMRSPPEDRPSLFDVAVAGPLAGLVIAIPALLIGLHSSSVENLGMHPPPGALDGATRLSILFGLLGKLSFGHALSGNTTLHLSPLAFAGWLGLYITGLNLLPIGQLDGGHTARSMFGHKAGSLIGTVGMWALFVWALLDPSKMFWAIIVFFLAGRATPPLNDLTPISPGRQRVGWFTFLILALILIPMPDSWF
jgi:membrane-associated protease RseP (regulator of RpoE activity)